MSENHDALTPAEIARRVLAGGVAKAGLSGPRLFLLAVLAGVFIGFGALAYILVTADSTLGFGPTKLIGGLAFATGLILVVVAGAELFTGDTLMVMPWLEGDISGPAMARTWGVVYFGNFVGAVGLAAVVVGSGVLDQPKLAEVLAALGRGKLSLGPMEAFLRGVLCNILVCLAVWMSLGARRISGKIMAIAPPIAVFVALGFEHSVANMFVLPTAMLAGVAPPDMAGLAGNLLFVTLGNVVGGGALLGAAYWYIYLDPKARPAGGDGTKPDGE